MQRESTPMAISTRVTGGTFGGNNLWIADAQAIERLR